MFGKKTCLVMSHVVNKAVEVQFKTKSAVVIEMLSSEVKGRDRHGGCKQKKHARVHVMVGGSQKRAWASIDGNETSPQNKQNSTKGIVRCT